MRHVSAAGLRIVRGGLDDTTFQHSGSADSIVRLAKALSRRDDRLTRIPEELVRRIVLAFGV